MTRLHGRKGAANVQEEWYDAIAWTQRSGECSGRTVCTLSDIVFTCMRDL